jgi:formylglycine-generating enzyme required for sulfatase activity
MRAAQGLLISMIRYYKSAVLFWIIVLPALYGGAFSSQATEKTYTNSIGMEFVLIPAGWFTRGANNHYEDAAEDERERRITISKPFYLGKYEVTQAQWTAVMGSNPSRFKGRTNPVEQISWHDALEFITRLNQKEGHARYRLPTEAEWEYAARARNTGAYSFAALVTTVGEYASYKVAEASLGRYAWYHDNSGDKTHPVGQKQPNAWGLYDMHGNVWEWVQDWYGEQYYLRICL